MRLAVVIPVYNHARYIGRALESVLTQSRPPDRVICIDDGSRDDSLAVCRTFADRGVEVHGQENQGAHATINRLIGMASEDCDVIAILNSDDFYAPERFAKCLPELENDPAAQVVASGLVLMDDDDQSLPEDHPRGRWLRAVWSRGADPETDPVSWMGEANFIVSSSNIIARREFFPAHPFKPYRFNHDYYFLSQAALRGQLRVVREPLLHYRVHDTNTINTKPAPLLRELLRQWLDLYRDLAPELASDPALRARFYRFTRASWDNLSGLHHGVFQAVLAGFLTNLPDDAVETTVAALDEAAWPELSVFPNKDAVNTYDGASPLPRGAGALAERIATLKQERDTARNDAKAQRSLARLRQSLLASKWVALGRALGLAGNLGSDAGKSAAEKLASLHATVQRSGWLQFAARRGWWQPPTP
jgi:glycosyltransferase involved in cell wall biosynthesis